MYNDRDLVARVNIRAVDEGALRSQLEVSLSQFRKRRNEQVQLSINEDRAAYFRVAKEEGSESGAVAVAVSGKTSRRFSLPLRPIAPAPEDRATLPQQPSALDLEHIAEAQLLVYTVAGQITYVNASAHVFRTKKILAKGHGSVNIVLICLDNIWAIDIDGVDALHEIVELYSDAGKLVAISGLVRTVVRTAFKGHEFFDNMCELGLVFTEYSVAMNHFFPESPLKNAATGLHNRAQSSLISSPHI